MQTMTSNDPPHMPQASAYFSRRENIDDPAVLSTIAATCGLDGNALINATAEQAIKDQLRANTEEAIARGAYGSPIMLIDQSLYFGNEQLPPVRSALLESGS